MNDESPLWGTWLMAGLVLICCAGPFLIAAVGAGGLSLAAAWLQPYRVQLLTAACVLFALGAYVSRIRLKPRCDANDARVQATGGILALMMWTGALLALVAVFLSIVSRS